MNNCDGTFSERQRSVCREKTRDRVDPPEMGPGSFQVGLITHQGNMLPREKAFDRFGLDPPPLENGVMPRFPLDLLC